MTMGRPLIPSLLSLLALSLSTCSLGTSPEHEGITEYRSIVVAGEDRTFVVHRPKGVKAEGAGLIMAFHGYGMTGLGLQRLSDLDRIARDLDAIIVYPDAASPYWAEDCDCVAADQTHGVADTAFVSQLMDGLAPEFELDPNRRFGVGFSQGGLFVMRLACQMTHRFDAIVEVASTMALPLAAGCNPSNPISVLTILSQRDDSSPWEGYDGGAFSTLGGEETAQYWGEKNQCAGGPERTEEDGVLRLRYRSCSAGTTVELVGPEDGEHSWQVSPGISTRKEVVSFLGG